MPAEDDLKGPLSLGEIPAAMTPPVRVMWLLNHTTAREFEVPMLKKIGITEIFLPKSYPQDPIFRSASVDFSEDANLTIPASDLAILNATDWYKAPSQEVWDIANRHFSILFFIGHSGEFLRSLVRNFKNTGVWRGYGLDKSTSYSKLLAHHLGSDLPWRRLGSRFWFGEAYPDLGKAEGKHLSRRSVYLPLGLSDARVRDFWRGTEPSLLFVCPDIAFNPYYDGIYQDFKETFGDLQYVVAGAQPVAVSDPHVLGYLPRAEFEGLLRNKRAMFYHSTEPRHVHYHPFEAVRSGMPLIFMAGGLLDTLGGAELPGRAVTLRDARSKVMRLLSRDEAFIAEVRQTQPRLLERMAADACEVHWREGIARILDEIKESRDRTPIVLRQRPTRIAVILPIAYRGGTLRAVKMIAEAIASGSRSMGEPVDVVVAQQTDPESPPLRFDQTREAIKTRSYKWVEVDAHEALRTMRLAGNETWRPDSDRYVVADDGIQHLCDCDLWLVVSDRLVAPLLPLRPVVTVIFDYLQRHFRLWEGESGPPFMAVNHAATKVLVTTEATRSDALQFAGLEPGKVVKVPILIPDLGVRPVASGQDEPNRYFLWTTNAAPHKNHRAALEALIQYYEVYGGTLQCHVTGVNTGNLLKSAQPHLAGLDRNLSGSRRATRAVKFLGELSEGAYRRELAGAQFVWHPALIDNGTFSVVEAANFGVPSLSSDYPAMREMDRDLKLNLSYMDSTEPDNMAQRLKWMEENSDRLRQSLPDIRDIAARSSETRYLAYWQAIRECL